MNEEINKLNSNIEELVEAKNKIKEERDRLNDTMRELEEELKHKEDIQNDRKKCIKKNCKNIKK